MDQAFASRLFLKGPTAPRDLEVYRRQTAAFERKFGREMRPNDPFFFDPDAPTPRFRSPAHAAEVIDLLTSLMAELGVEPAAIYAFWKTGGLFPTPDANLTRAEIDAWNAAAAEYRAQVRRVAHH